MPKLTAVTDWGSFPTSPTFPLKHELRDVKAEKGGLTFKCQHLLLFQRSMRIFVAAASTLHPISLKQYSVLSHILNVYRTTEQPLQSQFNVRHVGQN